MSNVYVLQPEDILFVECTNEGYFVQLLTNQGEYRFLDSFGSAESAQNVIEAWYSVGSVCLDVFERADYWHAV